MTDKFNGFSQDEINRVSSAKKQTAAATSTITSSTEAQMKQAFRGQHTGLRRMPEKWSKTTTTTTTSEQLRKQQQQHTQKTQTSTMPTTTTTANSITGDKMQPTKKPPQQQPAKAQNEDDTLTEINLNESLSKSLENVLFYQPFKKPNEATKNEQKQSAAASTTPSDDSSILKEESKNSNSETINSSSSDDSSILPMPPHISSESHTMTNGFALESPFKGISLKDFETHRKMIQEQNKQKKDLLYKAIEQHSKKTAAETRKIEEIKNELAKLDNDLAMDVAILRKQIDNACVHFANVEKQYIKVEAQFLKAKLDLHNAAEKKELLTEHLCTVIAHNEDRKAQQLTELMQKVGLTDSGDYEPVPQAGTRQE